MAPSLVALSGPLHGQVVPIPESGLTIGRDAANDLHPADLALSRRHCAFMVQQGEVTVRDLESMNGTFVNGVPIASRVLWQGDQLKIGESSFLFLHHESALRPAAAVDCPADGNAGYCRCRPLRVSSPSRR